MTTLARPTPLTPLDGYERWARTYDRTPNPLLALERRVLTPMLPCIVGRHVLDLGCGTGRWLDRFVSVGAHAVGIDFSAAMLAEATRKPALRGRALQAELSRLPFRDGTFDLVLCSFVLEHCPDLNSVTREIARVSTPSASVYITQLHPDAARSGWACAFHDADGHAEIASRPHSLDSLVTAFTASDFELTARFEPSLGEPEREFFVASGREHFFDAACAVPAVLVCEFRRGNA